MPAIDIAEFGLDGPRVVQCLSTRFQVAQKIHAVTERFEARENERFRDLIDLLLLREIVEDLPSLRDAYRRQLLIAQIRELQHRRQAR